jgi:hypothetical protein
MSTLTEYREANPERFQMLRAAVAALIAEGVEVSHETLVTRLPADFDLSTDSTDPWQRIAAGVIGTTDTTESADAADAAQDDPETLRSNVVRLEQQVAEIRADLQVLTRNLLHARADFASSIQAYRLQIPSLTPEQNARQFIADSIRQRAEGNPRRPEPHARSHIDACGAWASVGDADTFVRKQLVRGYRRNAAPYRVR